MRIPRDTTFRFNRVMSIAVAAGLAVSGVQVLDTASPLGAPAAIAQSNTNIPADAVVVEGIFDKDGNKITADYDALANGNVELQAGWKIRLNVDMAKVSKGSTIEVFFGAAKEEHSGGGVSVGTADATFGIPGSSNKVLQVKNTNARFGAGKIANGISITGLDNADDVSGMVPVSVPISVHGSFYGTGDGLESGPTGSSRVLEDQPVKYWTRLTDGTVSSADTTPFGFSVTYKQIVSGQNENDKKYQSWTDAFVDPNGFDVHLGMHAITPVNPPNGTAAVTYVPKNDGNNGDEPWKMTDKDSWEPKITGVTLITGSGQPPLTQEQKDAVKLDVTPVDGGFRVTVSNIPQDARVSYDIKKIGLVPAAKSTNYRLAPTDFDPQIGTSAGFASANSAAKVSGIDGSVDATREPTAKVLINGKEWTKDNPYKAKPGEEIELTMKLGLGGNARITHPKVTDAAGNVVAEDEKISFLPGEEKEITFKYTPTKEDSELKFTVTYETDESAEASTWVEQSGCDCTVEYQGEEKPVRDVIDDLNKRLEDAEKEAEDLKGKIKELEDKNKELDGRIKDAEDAIKEAEDAIKDAQDKNKELEDRIKDADKAITDLENTNKDLNDRLSELEGRLNSGLGRCIGTVGGTLLFLLPAVALVSQLVGGSKNVAIDQFIAETQKQMGIWNPHLAKAVDDNRQAIAAAFGGLTLLTLALIPGVCGEKSLGKAATEELSSNKGNGSSETE